MRWWIAVTVLLLAACAGSGGPQAREIRPGQGGYQLGDSLIALQWTNRNFEDAIVSVELPEGQRVRLGYVPGQDSRAWLVPLQISGNVTFDIRLQASASVPEMRATGEGAMTCRSSMFFVPGTARSLIIRQRGGPGSICPGRVGATPRG